MKTDATPFPGGDDVIRAWISEVYAQRREFFIEEFQKYLGRYLDLEVTPAGLHFVAWLRHKEDLPSFLRAREKTVARPSLLSAFCIKARLDPGFVFGFAAWPPAQIREVLVKFTAAFEEERSLRRR